MSKRNNNGNEPRMQAFGEFAAYTIIAIFLLSLAAAGLSFSYWIFTKAFGL